MSCKPRHAHTLRSCCCLHLLPASAACALISSPPASCRPHEFAVKSQARALELRRLSRHGVGTPTGLCFGVGECEYECACARECACAYECACARECACECEARSKGRQAGSLYACVPRNAWQAKAASLPSSQLRTESSPKQRAVKKEEETATVNVDEPEWKQDIFEKVSARPPHLGAFTHETRTHTHARAHARAHTHTYAYTHAHTHTHARMHTHAHARTYVQGSCLSM